MLHCVVLPSNALIFILMLAETRGEERKMTIQIGAKKLKSQRRLAYLVVIGHT